ALSGATLRGMKGHLATAVDVVVLVSEILVLAFAAIELVPLPIMSVKPIVAIPAIIDILSLSLDSEGTANKNIVAIPAIIDIISHILPHV
ncbi:MAG TPA: hypothetical protein VFI90_19180, partial [Rubrobacter sp.]|nr:hypothetical protein [Rubrobacter sp.]